MPDKKEVKEVKKVKKKPANYYYDNDIVQEYVIEYLSYPAEDRDSTTRCIELKQLIMVEVGKVINGIIFRHKFTVWEPYDDLYQEATEACMKALDRFNPFFVTSKGEYATTFNYFSLTAKRCLKFYTMRNQKNRNNYGIDDYAYSLEYTEDLSEGSGKMISDEFIKHLRDVFVKKGHKKFLPLIDILQEYLDKIGSFNKRDYFKYCKSFGWSANLIRKFMKIIKENKHEFYEAYETYN